MVMNPKMRKRESGGQESPKREDRREDDRVLVGIDAISAYLGHCSNWAIHRRQEYDDFPVRQDGYTRVWESTERELDEWRSAHPDLFTTRKERLAQRADNEEMRPSRW